MRVTIAGAGYVGLSLAILLAQKCSVIIYDILPQKVDLINKRVSPIEDEMIESYLNNEKLDLVATLDVHTAFLNADYVVIATPTDYDQAKNRFDTKSIEVVIENVLKYNPDAYIIIKSTIPVGYTDLLRKKYNKIDIVFSPEFLREGRALYDNLYPNRIIVGGKSKKDVDFANILKDVALLEEVPVLHTNTREAEAIKLFANSYLAMRVAFFNELDNYCLSQHLDSRSIINGVCFDSRIGEFYNNPSFGYGGYCLPKDTKQLDSTYNDIPHPLIHAIIGSNEARKSFIVQNILDHKPQVVGVYRLVMKYGSDNFRASAVFDIISQLLNSGVKVIVYEPNLSSSLGLDISVIDDLDVFKLKSDIILANRISIDLEDCRNKVFSRDLYNRD